MTARHTFPEGWTPIHDGFFLHMAGNTDLEAGAWGWSEAGLMHDIAEQMEGVS